MAAPIYVVNVDYIERVKKRLELLTVPDKPDFWQMYPFVFAVTSVDELLSDVKIKNDDVSCVVGLNTMYTVPDRKRNQIIAVYFERHTGDRNCSSWRIVAADGSTNAPIDNFTNAASYYTGILGQPVWLDSGFSIQLGVADGTTDGDFYFRMLYREADSFTS